MPDGIPRRRFIYRYLDKEYECMDKIHPEDSRRDYAISIRNCKKCNRVNAFRANVFPDTYECYYCNPNLWAWIVK